MGIHTWSKSAALILALASFQNAYSATQVSTPTTPFSNIMNAAQGAIGLPYGDSAYFGPEFTSEHTAGNRFQAGQSVPASGASSSKVKVAIKPVVTINPAKLAKSAVASMKAGGVPAVVAQAAVLWAIDQIPGASIENGQPVKVPSVQSSPTPVTYWTAQRPDGTPLRNRYAGTGDSCRALASNYPAIYLSPTNDPDTYACHGTYTSGSSGPVQGYIIRVSYTCDYGVGSNYMCLPESTSTEPPQPFTDTDFLALEAAIAQVTNSDWLRDLTKAKCEGSLSPEACYQDLVDRRPNHGPSSQTGPAFSTTTTTTNSDGTTSTTTTTTQNKYDYTYTDNSYTYRTTTTNTTTTDGQTTTETIADTSDPDTPPEQERPEDEQDYSFEDSDFPSVDPFYEQKYPDGLQGVWNVRKAEFEDSAFMDFLSSFIPSFSGSCPGWSMNVNIASWASFGVHEFQSLCWVFDFIKVVLLVSAAFLCRALIFGG